MAIEDEVVDLNVAEQGELETVQEQIQEQQNASQDNDIPEKYRGKSAAELARMHQETERTLSRQGQELGEIRKLADELLKSQLQKKQETEKPEPEIDFFENPQEAIRREVDRHPKVLEAEKLALEAQKAQRKRQLLEMHPDVMDIVQDNDFAEWVKSSPVRLQLLQAADNYDVAAGHELLSTWKEIKSLKQQKVKQDDVEVREKSLSAAAVDSGGSGESSKKIYRRTDLIRLKIKDPAKYDAMQHEIATAYQEGRVR